MDIVIYTHEGVIINIELEKRGCNEINIKNAVKTKRAMKSVNDLHCPFWYN